MAGLISRTLGRCCLRKKDQCGGAVAAVAAHLAVAAVAARWEVAAMHTAVAALAWIVVALRSRGKASSARRIKLSGAWSSDGAPLDHQKMNYDCYKAQQQVVLTVAAARSCTMVVALVVLGHSEEEHPAM